MRKKKILLLLVVIVVIGYFVFKIANYKSINGIILGGENIQDFDKEVMISNYHGLRNVIISYKKDTIYGVKKTYENGVSKYVLIKKNILFDKTTDKILLENIETYPLAIKISPDDRYLSFIDENNYINLVVLNSKKVERRIQLGYNVYDWIDKDKILYSEEGIFKIYNVELETVENYDNYKRGDLIDVSADKKSIMYSSKKDEIIVENIENEKVMIIKRKRDSENYVLSPNGEHIAFLIPKKFSKFEKNLCIVNLNGKNVYCQSGWKTIDDWK